MLDYKKQRKEYRTKAMFKFMESHFSAVFTRMTTEYVILRAPQQLTAETLEKELDAVLPFECVFSLEEISNDFFDKGRFVCFDKGKASRVLYDSFTFWMADKNEKIRAFKEFFYNEYFSKLAYIKPCVEGMLYFIFNDRRVCERYTFNEHELYEEIINGKIAKGDSVRNILFPKYDLSDIENEIEKEIYNNHFQRLYERRGDDVFLVNDDPTSLHFLMAFLMSLPFTGKYYRKEMATRLATLLMKNGATLYRRTET